MPIRLSAVGISESKPVSESDLKPFNLPEGPEEYQPTDAPAVFGTSLLSALREWAELQRKSFDVLVKAFSNVPDGFSIVTSGAVKTPHVDAKPLASYPSDLLGKPWDNILIDNQKLGIPAGCVKVLSEAGIVSLAGLSNCIAASELTRLPKVGKAKASVITEVFRAFERAVEEHKKGIDS